MRADLDEAGHPKCNANVKVVEVKEAEVKEANVVVVTSGARRCFSG